MPGLTIPQAVQKSIKYGEKFKKLGCCRANDALYQAYSEISSCINKLQRATTYDILANVRIVCTLHNKLRAFYLTTWISHPKS